MHTDVIDLRDFYATPLGRTARGLIRKKIGALWPHTRQLSIIGYGYAIPYLQPFDHQAERVIALMPEKQGVLRWPGMGQNRVGLTCADSWPLPDRSVDRVLIIHGLEFAEPPHSILREAWRVLSDGGRLLVVVANRRGIWARVDFTPFGWGQPYSHGQLHRSLRENLFTPTQTGEALFIPPLQSRLIRATAPAWEKIGQYWLGQFSGVVLMEAGKQIHAPHTFLEPRYSKPVLARSPVGTTG